MLIGAISLLNSMKNIDFLSFGVEDDDLIALKRIASILVNEPNQYKKMLREELDKGISFPKARSNAIVRYTKDKSYEAILEGSNNILAIEYLKALKTQNSKIKPVIIKREKVTYNSEKIVDEFASSSGIRQLVIDKKYEAIKKVVPKNVYYELMSNIKNKTIVKNITAYEKIISYKIRTSSLQDIKNLPEVNEGLENLIKNVGEKNSELINLINDVKSKRYTQTKIQRILLSLILGITKKDVATLSQIVPYARVLGFNKKGKKLLSTIDWKVNIITSVKKFENFNTNKKINRMLEIDKIASDVYTLGYESNFGSKQDYTTPIIIIK